MIVLLFCMPTTQDTDSKEAINNMGQGLDANQDGKVGFEEYMKLVGYLAVSLSEQRTLAQEEPVQNAASGQVAQSTPDKEEKKPEANTEAKEETKSEVKEEQKAAATGEVKVESKADGKVEIKAEGGAQPQVAKEEPAAPEAAAAAVEVVVKEEKKEENTVKVEEAAEKVEAKVENKSEEATS